MKKYDFLIVGTGLFGSVFAQKASQLGYKVLVIEKRNHIGGNCYTERIGRINVHKYGAHIFHTNDLQIWQYINQFATFNNFINRPKVVYKGHIYSFPINLMTLHQLWGIKTPEQARQKLTEVSIPKENPQNMEDWVLSQVGTEIYETFIKGYTIKQWQKHPRELPVEIIKRIPIRLNFDDNYFTHKFQGIPLKGYTPLFKKLLTDSEVKISTDYFSNRGYFDSIASQVVYTGRIDEFFDYEFGQLEYRSLRFHTKILEGEFQGNAVMNYTDADIPFTRILEHKYFEQNNCPETAVTWEYPDEPGSGKPPFYPVPTERNTRLFAKYQKKAELCKNVLFGGRLASYQYMDMDLTIKKALALADLQC